MWWGSWRNWTSKSGLVVVVRRACTIVRLCNVFCPVEKRVNRREGKKERKKERKEIGIVRDASALCELPLGFASSVYLFASMPTGVASVYRSSSVLNGLVQRARCLEAR
jgi:hypothetical protein